MSSKIAPATGHRLMARGLRKTYRMGGQPLEVLRGVDLDVPRGQWLAILGASGSGKSTLLHLLGGLDRPSAGEVHYGEQNVFALRRSRLDRYRNREVGFVFQFYHLLPELTAVQNVALAAMIGHSTLRWWGARRSVHQRAGELLERLGLGHRLKHRPNRLSGGERQRVAIARALINQPEVLLADEPTGNLDAATGEQILEVFREIHQTGQTIVMVTHDAKVAAMADHVVTLERGLILDDPRRQH